MYRLQLPQAGEPGAPALLLDTSAPPGGEVVDWLVDEEAAVVRGAMLRQSHGQYCLVLRTKETPRVGNKLWFTTCQRLGLPLPPIDEMAPPAYSEWRTVATWDGDTPRLLLGFRDETAWLTDSEGKVIAYGSDGSEFTVPLQ